MSEPSEVGLALAREHRRSIGLVADDAKDYDRRLALIFDRYMNPLDDYGAMVQLHQLFMKATIGTVYSDQNMRRVIDIIRRTGRKVQETVTNESA